MNNQDLVHPAAVGIPKWNYEVFTASSLVSAIGHLQDYGELGWEAISALEDRRGRVTVLFRREKGVKYGAGARWEYRTNVWWGIRAVQDAAVVWNKEGWEVVSVFPSPYTTSPDGDPAWFAMVARCPLTRPNRPR